MRARSTRIAWGLLAVFAAGYLAVPLSYANGNVQQEPGFYLALALAFTAFMVVGAVIVAHRPGNALGWIFSAIGLLSSFGVLTMEYAEYAEYAYLTNPGSLPGAAVAAWFSWWWLPILGLIFVFTPLLFPTGRLPSPRWRPVAVVGGLAIAAVTLLGAVRPTLKLQNEEVYLPNPVGLAGAPDPENGALGAVLLGVLAACMAASVVSVVLRFRRSEGVERQQLKWFTSAAALMLLVQLATMTVLPDGVAGELLFGLSIALVPIAAGVAILRYRLYDIDRLINRTLVSAALTAVLGAVYAGLVLALRVARRGGQGAAQLGRCRGHPGRGHPVPAVAPPGPDGRRPAPQPPPLRRHPHRRGVQRPPPRPGRPGHTRGRAADRGRADSGANHGIAMATALDRPRLSPPASPGSPPADAPASSRMATATPQGGA
jgi:hypothetical protein